MGRFLDLKSVQNRFQSGSGTMLNDDTVSKLKKKRAASVGRALTRLKVEVLAALGEGNREGADGFTRLTSLANKGSADLQSSYGPFCKLLEYKNVQKRSPGIFSLPWTLPKAGGCAPRTPCLCEGAAAPSRSAR